MNRLLLCTTVSIMLVGCQAAPVAEKPSTPPAASSSQSSSSSSVSSMNPSSEISMLSGKHKVTLATSKGDIVLELDADAAPKAVTNFVTLSERGYYTDILFHRVIPGFMIQGGDPDGTGRGGKSIYGETFEDETDASNPLMKIGYKEGAVAMANRGADTNGSQFFIMDTDYSLPPSYTIFGRVTSGMDIVHTIAKTPRTGGDKPLTDVTFTARAEK